MSDGIVWEKCVRLWGMHGNGDPEGKKEPWRSDVFTAYSCGVRVRASLGFGVVRLSLLGMLGWRGGWGLGAGGSPWQQSPGRAGPLEVQGERQSSIFRNWERGC